MPETAFEIPRVFAYLATFTWALSGALVGMHKGYDIAGVFVVALLSAVGGSMLRDGLFLHRIPPVLTDGNYLPLILLATLAIAFFGRQLHRKRYTPQIDRLVGLIDAVGTPAFAVVGMQLALGAGVPLPGVLLIGVINGFGGGLLRDVVVRDVPALLRPGQYNTLLLLLVCILFLALTLSAGLSAIWVSWSCIALYFCLRLLVVYYNVQTKPLLPG